MGVSYGKTLDYAAREDAIVKLKREYAEVNEYKFVYYRVANKASRIYWPLRLVEGVKPFTQIAYNHRVVEAQTVFRVLADVHPLPTSLQAVTYFEEDDNDPDTLHELKGEVTAAGVMPDWHTYINTHYFKRDDPKCAAMPKARAISICPCPSTLNHWITYLYGKDSSGRAIGGKSIPLTGAVARLMVPRLEGE